MRKSKENNSYDDATMRIILQPLVKDELRRFDEYNKQPHEYSHEFLKKVRKLFRGAELFKALGLAAVWGKRVIACIMVAATLVLVSCAAIKPLREKIADAIVEWFEEYVAVKFVDDSADPLMRVPMYIPENYVVVSDVVLDDYRAIRYANNDGALISFICESNTSDAVYLDHERHDVESVTIGKTEGLYFRDKAGIDHMVSWGIDGFVYIVTGGLSKDELIKFAESVE